MILVCGATGLLGGEIARRLAARGERLRVLLRPTVDATPLADIGADVVRGDLREPASLADALADVRVVISTVTAMSRLLAGGEKTTITETDEEGHANLIAAAEDAGAERFVFLSFAGVERAPRVPLVRAKLATEARLSQSPLREVVVRPDAFQEVWLSPQVGFDWPNRKLTIYGKGENPIPYNAVGDVADATVGLALADDPPRVLEFGGPERHTRRELARLFEDALGEPLKVRTVPRAALRVGSRALAPLKQELSSVMGLSLDADTNAHPYDDAPLRELGITARPTTTYVRELVAAR